MSVLSRIQALDAGHTDREIDAHVRSGRWLALRRGVYLTAATRLLDPAADHAVAVQAAVLTCGAAAVGSHESAAVVHGLALLERYDGPPLLSRIRPPSSHRPYARLCAPLASQVPEHHRVVRHGAPVTSLARTAVDLARTRPPLTAVIVLDAALRMGVSRTEMLEVLDDQRGWPGSVIARGRLGFADGTAESPLESVGRLRMSQLELPPPRLQVVLGGLTGPIGRVDFYWEDHRTIGEADGRLKYADGPDAVFAEKQREDLFRDGGYEVFRFGWDEALHRPQVIDDRARRAFLRGTRRRS